MTDTFRNIRKGAGWKESRGFIEQRHPLPGDDIVPITCCLSAVETEVQKDVTQLRLLMAASTTLVGEGKGKSA